MIHKTQDAKSRTPAAWARPSTMLLSGSRLWLNRAAEPVYERIKARLLDRSPGSGELQIGILAEELGTSSTPVREALVRLAAERIIAYVPKRGFLAKTVTESELRGIYTVSQTLLQAALNTRRKVAHDRTKAQGTQVSEEAALRAGDAAATAQAVAGLFLRIALNSHVDEIAAIVHNTNDRLHHPRMAEFAVIDAVPADVLTMDALYAAGEYEALKRTIRDYHDMRLRMLASIHRELVLMQLTGGQTEMERDS